MKFVHKTCLLFWLSPKVFFWFWVMNGQSDICWSCANLDISWSLSAMWQIYSKSDTNMVLNIISFKKYFCHWRINFLHNCPHMWCTTAHSKSSRYLQTNLKKLWFGGGLESGYIFYGRGIWKRPEICRADQSQRLTMPEVHFVSVLLIPFVSCIWRVWLTMTTSKNLLLQKAINHRARWGELYKSSTG